MDYIRMAGVMGVVGVAAGAFGAHGLQGVDGMTDRRLSMFKTGADYLLLRKFCSKPIFEIEINLNPFSFSDAVAVGALGKYSPRAGTYMVIKLCIGLNI